MDQRMDDKIRQISNMLSSPDAQEGIRQLFSSLNSSRNMDDESYSGDYEVHDQGNTGNAGQMLLRENDWIRNIQNLLNHVNSIEDSRINLLHSIQPFLNPARRERCVTCLNILKIASILRAVTNNNGRLL